MYESKANSKYLGTSPYGLMSILLSLVPFTTKITILSCYEATAQRINAVQPKTT